MRPGSADPDRYIGLETGASGEVRQCRPRQIYWPRDRHKDNYWFCTSCRPVQTEVNIDIETDKQTDIGVACHVSHCGQRQRQRDRQVYSHLCFTLGQLALAAETNMDRERKAKSETNNFRGMLEPNWILFVHWLGFGFCFFPGLLFCCCCFALDFACFNLTIFVMHWRQTVQTLI